MLRTTPEKTGLLNTLSGPIHVPEFLSVPKPHAFVDALVSARFSMQSTHHIILCVFLPSGPKGPEKAAN
jgi:hypothetical protein